MNEIPTVCSGSAVQNSSGSGATLTSLSILEELIGFDTISCNSNLELICYVEDYLSQYGIKSILVNDESGEKANLYATIGPSDRGGVMSVSYTHLTLPTKA